MILGKYIKVDDLGAHIIDHKTTYRPFDGSQEKLAANLIRFSFQHNICNARTYRYISRGGRIPPLELQIYRVKISKIRKINFFLSIGPPLGKNRSPVPVHTLFRNKRFALNLMP